MKARVNNLVQRAQRGDVEAFGKLVETFQDAVFGTAWTIARNFHDAQDIAQEAFILTDAFGRRAVSHGTFDALQLR